MVYGVGEHKRVKYFMADRDDATLRERKALYQQQTVAAPPSLMPVLERSKGLYSPVMPGAKEMGLVRKSFLRRREKLSPLSVPTLLVDRQICRENEFAAFPLTTVRAPLTQEQAAELILNAAGLNRGTTAKNQSLVGALFSRALASLRNATQIQSPLALRNAAHALKHYEHIMFDFRDGRRRIDSTLNPQRIVEAASQLEPGEHLYIGVTLGKGPAHALGVSVSRRDRKSVV